MSGYSPRRTPKQSQDVESDTMADIIASIVHDQTQRNFSLPSSHRRNGSIYSFEPLEEPGLEHKPWNSRAGSTMTAPRDSIELSGLSHEVSHSHGIVPEPFDSAQQSMRGLSRPGSHRQKGVSGSFVSLQHSKYDHASTLSEPRDDGSVLPSPVPPIPRDEDGEKGKDEPAEESPGSYPSAAKTAIIMFSLYISIFLVALDRTIVGPAIPEITNQFHSIDDIGWYGSAYMLTSCGFILVYGRIYTFFPTKPVFLSGIVTFEAGSAICGAANSSLVLIIGRAVSGLGSAGIFTGAILIMLNTVPLHRRPMLQGLFGACFGVASVAGPLLGGAFTGSSLTWRWCFYINIPLGGVTIIVVLLFLHLKENKPKLGSWMNTLRHLDPVGTALFMSSITCLLLALEWGAAQYAWSAPVIIALLTAFAALFVAFIAWQYYTRNTTATVPGRILFQRSVAFGGLSQFSVGSTMLSVSIYIPLWFQAIKGVSSLKSGINTIPLVLSVVVGSISSGALVQRIGYYTPFMIMGGCFMAVGTGLLTTWNASTPSSMWIGYQVILGMGVGWTMQHPNLAIQVVLPKQDVPTGTALLSLCQTLGGAVFVAVGQNVFIDKFTTSLGQINGIDVAAVGQLGATDLQSAVPAALLQKVLQAYNVSLTHGPFFAALIVACLALPSALGMEWRSVKQNAPPSLEPADAQDQERQSIESVDRKPSVSMDRRPEGLSTDPYHLDLPAPVPAWRKIYRSSGQFSQWMTAAVNPDLREQLGHRRQSGLRETHYA